MKNVTEEESHQMETRGQQVCYAEGWKNMGKTEDKGALGRQRQM
jgi:hypothetical protein